MCFNDDHLGSKHVALNNINKVCTSLISLPTLNVRVERRRGGGLQLHLFTHCVNYATSFSTISSSVLHPVRVLHHVCSSALRRTLRLRVL